MEGRRRGAKRCRSISHLIKSKPDLSLTAGLQALAILPSGSRYWCSTVKHLFAIIAGGPPQWHSHFPNLVHLISSVEPEPDAIGEYAAAMAWLTSTFVWVAQMGMARTFMARLRALCSGENDPTLRFS